MDDSKLINHDSTQNQNRKRRVNWDEIGRSKTEKHLQTIPAQVSLATEDSSLETISTSGSETNECGSLNSNFQHKNKSEDFSQTKTDGNNLDNNSNSISNPYFPNCCQFEIPVGTKEGSRITLTWPDGKCLFINCPEFQDPTKPQFIHVVAPDGDPPPFPLPPTPAKPAGKRKTRSKTESEEWLWKEYEKKSSRVGRSYQIKHLPRQGEDDNERTFESAEHDQIWDPFRANLAISQGEDIDGFLDSLDVPHQEIGMVALHESKYSVEKAAKYVKDMIKKNPDFQPWTRQMKRNFQSTLLSSYMDMSVVSNTVGKSPSACLTYYYGTFHQLKEFKSFRMKINSNYDDCAVCGEGGELICCDGCNIPYHLKCIKPSLKKVPEGDWFCHFCKKKASCGLCT